MLSELALVDWVALLIALVLLGVAGIASYLSYGASNHAMAESLGTNEPLANEPRQYTPSHAQSIRDDGSTSQVSRPAHAAPQPSAAEPAGPLNVPPPPILTRSSAPEDIGEIDTLTEIDLTGSRHQTDAESTEHTSQDEDHEAESIADRAARLRNRPISEPEANMAASLPLPIVAVVDEEATELVFANATNKLSVGMENAEGFKKRAPGFFSDPIGRHELRYWNGSSWTEYVKEGGDRFIDPL